ncbi:MAG: hypothetical protein Q8R18_02250 [bacterium]|nr:hypothetical protein [bacterium]
MDETTIEFRDKDATFFMLKRIKTKLQLEGRPETDIRIDGRNLIFDSKDLSMVIKIAEKVTTQYEVKRNAA